MEKTIISIIAGVVVVGGGVWAATSYFQADSEIPESADTEQDSDAAEDEDERLSYIDRISAVHFYEDGTHTFAGEIDMPTPCDLLETEASTSELFPDQISLEFSVINEEADMCAQVMTPQRFLVEVEAPEDATVTATLMGRSVELNLREPQPGETPDDFELFIKG